MPQLIPQTALIALGSNLGDRHLMIQTALDRLNATDGIRVTKISSPLENPAIGGPADSPAFLNSAAELKTSLPAAELLTELLKVELGLGRHRTQKWGPRSIDLDLLLYADQIINAQSLIVPHPLMHERLFVLQPLAEIAPEVVHPILKKTIESLLEELRLTARQTGS